MSLEVSALPEFSAQSQDGLYAWQKEALDAWRVRYHRGVIEAVTGTGKTRVGIAASRHAITHGYRVLVLVPTVELMKQWAEVFADQLPEVSVGFIGDGSKDRFDRYDVLISTIQSASRILARNPDDLIRRGDQRLLIADECHRYGAEKYSKALNERFEWRLGLTATYQREDDANKRILDPYFSGVIFRMDFARALKDDLIAPFHVALVGVPLLDHEQQSYDDYSSQLKKLTPRLESYLSTRVSDPAFHQYVGELAKNKGTFSEVFLARRYIKLVSNRLGLLSEAKSKLLAIRELEPVLRQATATLIFTLTQNSAKSIAAATDGLGIDTRAMYSGLEADDRHSAMEDFRHGRTKALAAPRILDEGIDVPNADLGIVVASHRSKRQLIQRVGRVVRKKSDGRNARFIFLYSPGTVEDPTMMNDDHLKDIVTHATESRHFHIKDHEPLINFLSPRIPENPPEGKAQLQHGDSSPARSSGAPSGAAHATDITAFLGRLYVPADMVKLTTVIHAALTEEDQFRVTRTIAQLLNCSTDMAGQHWNKLRRQCSLSDISTRDHIITIKRANHTNQRLKSQEVLTVSERKRLEHVVNEGANSFRRIVLGHLRLVLPAAISALHPQGITPNDQYIVQGILAIRDAVRTFPLNTGDTFEAHASATISDHLSREPSKEVIAAAASQKSYHQSTSGWLAAISVADVSKFTGFTHTQISNLLKWKTQIPAPDSPKETLPQAPEQIKPAEYKAPPAPPAPARPAPAMPSPPKPTPPKSKQPETSMNQGPIPLAELNKRIVVALTKVDGLSAFIIDHLHGLNGATRKSAEQISTELHLPPALIKQLEHETMKQLRSHL